MAIKELDPGQTHTFASTPLVVELTGAVGGVSLSAMDQAGGAAETKRIAAGSILLVPSPRRLRLVAQPTQALTFPAGTTLGLSLRTEGSSTALVQIVVSAVDVAALPQHELAVLEFAPGRSVLSVPGTRREIIDREQARSVAGGIFSREMSPTIGAGGVPSAAAGDQHAPAVAPEDEGHIWLEPGRYAIREAAQLPGAGSVAPEIRSAAWGMVLDGSISLRRLHDRGQLDPLIGLLAGIFVEATDGKWAVGSVVAGARSLDATAMARSTAPRALSDAAFEQAPSSWAVTASAVANVAQRVGAGGVVVLLADGVPGDLAALIPVVESVRDRTIALVVLGVSTAHGLVSDGEQLWWREELAPLGPFADLPHVRIAAVQLTSEGDLRLDGTRPAELAQRLTHGRLTR